jgi:hypothetical protein
MATPPESLQFGQCYSGPDITKGFLRADGRERKPQASQLVVAPFTFHNGILNILKAGKRKPMNWRTYQCLQVATATVSSLALWWLGLESDPGFALADGTGAAATAECYMLVIAEIRSWG